jgi:hypothetical protein
MTRPLRIEYPGAVYHVTSRGNAQQEIVHDDGDRVTFFDVLKSARNRFNVVVHAYCMMGCLMLHKRHTVHPWTKQSLSFISRNPRRQFI